MLYTYLCSLLRGERLTNVHVYNSLLSDLWVAGGGGGGGERKRG